MKIIGIIAAVEKRAVIKAFGESINKENKYGFDIYEYIFEDARIIITDSGAGEIAASAATQMLICEYSPDFILNVGICGGLTKEMSTGTLCVAEKVVHYDYDISSAKGYKPGMYMGRKEIFFENNKELIDLAKNVCKDIKSVRCASADKLVIDMEERISLGNKFGCEICEMEAAGILITSQRNSVPCLMIKAVSDGIDSSVDDLMNEGESISDMAAEAAKKIVISWIENSK